MKIKTLVDIANLSEDELNRFIPDLINFCSYYRGFRPLVDSGLAKNPNEMEWIDDGKNEAHINVYLIKE